MNDFLEVAAWILMIGGIATALVWLGFVIFWRISDRRDNMALNDCGPQDPGAPVSFQLHLLFNELCELHAGKEVSDHNWTVHFICACASAHHEGCPKAPDVSDKAVQESQQARGALGGWLHAFSMCLDNKNQEDCLAIEDALKVW